ncbi:MAG: PEP-CTERM sorting domain-containing protein [Nodularia sp. (in: Bacteria)]|nr:MAG: PEP-CTERM sorting domain-containing protein [Nodularia sp. (in: cyanobacteria)]
MKVNSPAVKFGLKVASSSFLATTIIGFSSASAFAAQFISVQSTITLSGTIDLPNFNTNFNNRTTRVKTDSQGRYFRNGVLVYQSDEVKTDDGVNYYVDFLGIPFVSLDGVLTSPVLSDGELKPYNYQNNPSLPGVKFEGVVQDEFVFGRLRAFYDGILTDPSTGKRYQGVFQFKGINRNNDSVFSPRYDNINGGNFPTVFDFKSDIPGQPTITSLSLDNFLVSFNVRIEGEGVEIISAPPSDVTSVPEPATVGGLFLAGIMGLFVKRKSA